MDNKSIVLLIFLMALVTYLPRAAPLLIFRKKIKNKYLCSILTYLPYGILVAMVFPAVIFSTESIISACIGGVVGLFMSYKKMGLFPVAIGATAAVFVVELIIKYCV